MLSRTDTWRLATVCGLLFTACACSRGGPDEMGWARAALERNPRLELVAADAQGHTFTIRMKDTGELRTVPLEELTAGPRESATATVPVTAPAAAAPPAATLASAGEPATPAEPAPEESAPPAAAPPSAAASEDAQSGSVLRSGPGYTIRAAGEAARAEPRSVSAVGPGYSVKSSGTGPRSAAREGPAGAGTPERRHEPIVCQGARLLHIDNRNLEFDGDAVSAQDGCEIHITNSHISATGIGVLARAANVHIDNSLIEGEAGSIDAADGAQIYATASHFRGLSRRLDTAAFHDLGGNVWN